MLLIIPLVLVSSQNLNGGNSNSSNHHAGTDDSSSASVLHQIIGGVIELLDSSSSSEEQPSPVVATDPAISTNQPSQPKPIASATPVPISSPAEVDTINEPQPIAPVESDTTHTVASTPSSNNSNTVLYTIMGSTIGTILVLGLVWLGKNKLLHKRDSFDLHEFRHHDTILPRQYLSAVSTAPSTATTIVGE